jgi:hypothetical protein
MKGFKILIVVAFTQLIVHAQNDIDAIRYSQTFFGGTSRSKAMAGSFGALGADGSCSSSNPAGIGLYKKGDVNISFGLKFFTVEANHNSTLNKDFKASVPFDGLTIIGAGDSKENPDNHHAFGLSCSQIANFNSNTTIEGRANFKSIANDFLLNAKGQTPSSLDASYSGMAFETYLIDTIDGQYYSFINTKYDVLQNKTIETTGRINEWNINYVYGYKDKLYLGVVLGIPTVIYNYNSVYTESDDKDSIRISNYNYSVYNYPGSGGFKNMSYQETYKTTGSGYNLKFGAIYRATDFMRIGASFHSPTVYSLTDSYLYKMTANYDNGGTFSSQYPADKGGIFNYKVITPMKLIGSVAFIYKKLGVINIDYELINYRQANLQSTPQEFTSVNTTIRNKYNQTSNLKVGTEINLKPMYVRLGYAMYGSPFGDTFQGDFVKTFYTGGLGFRREKLYLDVSFTKSNSTENYYMYNPKFVDRSTLINSGTTIAITLGSKF